MALEVATGNQLENEVGAAVMLADFIEGDDVGVIEGRDDLGLGAKPSVEHFGGTCDARVNGFERHDAIESLVPGFVDDPHSASGDLVE